MTVHGAKILREELDQLKFVERPRIVDAISEARKHGDLKENAEYHAAKERQSFLEGRIKEVESNLSMAVVIDVHKVPKDGRVVFGVTMCLENTATDAKVQYQIVGDDEADFKVGKLSINSPIARAALGKSKGDVFEVHAPGGRTEYEIVDVLYK